MNASEIRRLQVADRPELTAVPGAAEYVRCDECDAPVDETQRYCVNCGAHRRDVRDPATRYLGHAAAGARVARRQAVAGAPARRAPRSGGSGRTRGRRTVSLGTAVLIALVPLAGAGGLIVGQDQSGAATPQVRTGHKPPRSSGPTSHHTATKPTTGSSYVNSQKGLGNSVSIP